ncbi:MAG TPA: UDP-N-acetylmuramate--L-alanine ligase [Gammaproteobacteria bacterium]|nr:UDP-N-acetylmuramate--L-alanine ligase [Gammaproteobacteria bacterium]
MPDKCDQAMGRVRNIHFVGIGGAGMSGIAEVLHNLGYKVTGSDMRENSLTRHLEQLGIKVAYGHMAAHVNNSDVVVYSSAITQDNPELASARASRIPVIPRAEMLAELMRFQQVIAIAGTHGKTTTTSLVASVLTEGGLDPTYVIGGLLNSSGSHAWLGEGKYMIAEADESDASFLHLQPVIAVLTNIDADHMETYGGDFARLQEKFLEFLQQLPFYGLAVVCRDDKNTEAILDRIIKPVMTYGIDDRADIRAHEIHQQGARTWFSVSRKGEENWMSIELNLPGLHNVRNALAAITVAHQLGVSEEHIMHALKKFQGIARRFQILGEVMISDHYVLVIDDYAHHPTEISETLAAIHIGWPGSRILVVFQPHRFSRTRDLFDEFVQVLSGIDVLFLLDVYPAGEKPLAGADSRSLCRAIRQRGQVNPIFVEDREQLPELLENVVTDKDVLLILGAGDIGSFGTGLVEHFSAVTH